MSSRCITPFYRKEDAFTPLPCGKCPPCRNKRASNWAVRLEKEGERQTLALFVTLTYNTSHVPITENGYMSLSKEDVQLFLKRLRYYQKEADIKKTKNKNSYGKIVYYLCGEYGSKFSRPHYHIILFGAEHDSVIKAWRREDDKGHPKEIGTSYFGNVEAASIGYSLKYISKPGKIPIHKRDDRLPEFALMSKGIGSNYLIGKNIYWHHADIENRLYYPLKDGKKAALPRYYKEKIYNSEQKGLLKGVMERVGLAEEEKNRVKYPNYDRDKVEADLYAFRKLNHNNHSPKF